jgi:hypothetical protein
MIGEITEQGWLVGVRARRLYAVRLRLDPSKEHTTELSEDGLEAVAGDSTSTPQPNGKEAKG